MNLAGEPRYSRWPYGPYGWSVLLFTANMALAIAGIAIPYCRRFIPSGFGFAFGLIYGFACLAAVIFGWRATNRHPEWFSPEKHAQIVSSMSDVKTVIIAAVMTVVVGALAFTMTLSTVFTRLVGQETTRVYTVSQSRWEGGRRYQCYQIEFAELEFPQSISSTPCYKRHVPVGSRFHYPGWESSLGFVHVDPLIERAQTPTR